MTIHDARFSTAANDFADKNAELLQQVAVVNERGREMLKHVRVHPNNMQAVLSAVLYSRFLSNCQAGLYLTEVGLEHQAEMMLRPTLETMFTLCAIAKDEDYAAKFVSFDDGARRDQAKRLRRYKERIGAVGDEEDTKAKEVIDGFEESKLPKFNAFDAAEVAGLLDWYDTVYVASSDTLHSSVGSIEAHLNLDGDPPKLKSIDYGPSYKKALVVVVAYCQCIELVVATLRELFDLGEDEELVKSSSMIRQLYSNDG